MDNGARIWRWQVGELGHVLRQQDVGGRDPAGRWLRRLGCNCRGEEVAVRVDLGLDVIAWRSKGSLIRNVGCAATRMSRRGHCRGAQGPGTKGNSAGLRRTGCWGKPSKSSPPRVRHGEELPQALPKFSPPLRRWSMMGRGMHWRDVCCWQSSKRCEGTLRHILPCVSLCEGVK